MKMQSLQDLFAHELTDLYSAETQLVKALPKMAKAASFPELQSGFEEHLAQTEGHVERLERIFEQIEAEPNKRKKCKGMQGLIEEGKELIDSGADPEVVDAGLICAAQKVEHYEIAAYGCVRSWAEELGLKEAVSLLDATLEEEKATDKKLTQLAEQIVNQRAETDDTDSTEVADRQRSDVHVRGKARASR